MALSTQPYKGARDFYPDDKRVQKYLFSKMREVAERFGYEEYDAPILSRPSYSWPRVTKRLSRSRRTPSKTAAAEA